MVTNKPVHYDYIEKEVKDGDIKEALTAYIDYVINRKK